jgi:hypothetical protein
VVSQLAAVAATLVLAGLIGFQLLLAAGFPLGRFAWGGAHTVLPTRLRISSVLAVFVYLLAILVILEHARLIDLVVNEDIPRVATSVLAALFGLGVVMNAVSRSKSERSMALVALVLSALSSAVALGL